jgi:23S rRNA pseudouridine1911/1915/1917 synthase
VNQQPVILFEDSHCLALAKPPGQFTQGTWAPPGEITLETAVRGHLDPEDPQSVYLGIVHRLDRPTSGLLIWAKTPKSARRLSSQFQRRRVVKEYWAVVEAAGSCAIPTPAAIPEQKSNEPNCEQIWSDWLTGAHESGAAQAVEPGTKGARQAITRLRFAAAVALPPSCIWLRLWPETGRTHQLRAQTARRGMPILGDSTYGSALPFSLPQGIALHARALQFHHPITGIEITLLAPLPAAWAASGIVLPDTHGTGGAGTPA